MRLHRKGTAALAAAVLVTTGVLAGAGAPAAAEPKNPGLDRLRADATDGLRLDRGPGGRIEFVGTTAGNAVVNDAVSASDSPRAAARAHLASYGAALGLGADSELSVAASQRTPAGQDLVRFQQEVDGAPVIGGQVVVALRPDRQLGSMLATLSTARSLPAATVTASAARATALRAATRAAQTSGLAATSQGRAVWDPAVLGASGNAQGVWSFEVGDGAAVRRLVLVDDTTGRVLLNLDQIEHIDRVVCDRNNTPGAATACTSGFARTESSGISVVGEVNAAFDNAGSVSTAYQQIAGVDLTQALGIDVGGVKKLASTVRFCQPTGSCPYANAFWNGTQMFYGDTYAGADDVVGHEMTHGIIDQHSELFYWGQSGAMNESFADIMGEIVDHRAGLEAGDASWLLGEDLPIGAIRDMANPPSFGDPDRMTSPLWNANLTYTDNGGVHTNSGVGNKTAYLISQGGTFNGQTITGIDTDTGLTKTGRLYYEAIVRLTSGSDYANLASVLEQSCADFVAGGIGGFTPTDCANIAKAVAATELRTTPTNAPQPADAGKSCPTGTTMRELFNSETGAPATKFSSPDVGMWSYGVKDEWGSNATSGRDSWFGWNPDPGVGDPAASSLTATTGIALPAGQSSYLYFQQWRLFEWYPGRASGPYIDGGTVEIDAGAGPVDTAALPWTNGPAQTLAAYSPSFPNQWAGRQAFAGDSFGWTASQVDLTAYAGATVRPSFTTRGDTSDSYIGWWLDDISVYTCDVPPIVTPPPPPPVNKAKSKTSLKVKVGKKVVVIATVKVGTAKGTGKVTFKVDGKKIKKTVKLRKGKATLVIKGKKLAKLGRGKHKVKAAYSGSSTAKPSKAKKTFRLK